LTTPNVPALAQSRSDGHERSRDQTVGYGQENSGQCFELFRDLTRLQLISARQMRLFSA
jgi:hypothetical protein